MTTQTLNHPCCRLCSQGSVHTVEECRASEKEFYERLRDDIREAREQDADLASDQVDID